MRKTLSFDDVLLEPQFSDIVSRTAVNTEVSLGEFGKLAVPIVSAPMDTVTGVEMAQALSKEGGLPILHRYNTIKEQVKMATEANKSGKIVGAAVGVSGDWFDRASALVWETNTKVLCIDVAHGHHVNVRHAIEVLRNTFGTTIHIMAGNVATLQAFDDLSDWGADSIRVGVGGGSICSTRVQTGHGIPTLQSVMDCARSNRDAILIADGGIRSSGDIVKALAAGADLVMLGSLLGGTTEAPGKVTNVRGKPRKIYRGMASKEAQIDWKGDYRSFEGVSSTLPLKGPVAETIRDLETGIRSGMSYSGARTLTELIAKARFIRQSNAGIIESSTHVERM